MSIFTLIEKLMDFVDANTAYIPFVAMGLFALFFIINPPWKWGVELDAYDQLVAQLRHSGVAAPGVVVSASTNQTLKVPGRSKLNKVKYTVDVQPVDGSPAFRAKFIAWRPSYIFSYIRFNTIVGEAGQKIWVCYHPNDPAQMILDYYDDERSYVLALRELERRRDEFENVAVGFQSLLTSGIEASGVVLAVNDLDLLYDTGYAMIFDIEYTPRYGHPVKTTAHALTSRGNVDKYKPGTKVNLRYDPGDSRRIVISGLAEQNKPVS